MTRALEWLAQGRRGLWCGLGLFITLLATNWVGFLASDDVIYAVGAYGWLEQFPYVGGHGTIRYPLTMPMALSFLVLGENALAMVLPSLLYMIGGLSILWYAARKAGGADAAFGALLVLATSPLLVIQSTIASIDIVETAFLFASLALFWSCLDAGPDPRKLFAAGAMAGLAFLTRETAIFCAVFYALLFFAGHRFGRAHYLWIVAGFIAIWLVEVCYLWIMTGDPLYRINISLNHDSSIDRTIDLAGNMVVHPLLDPLLVLLANQEFMALYLIAIPAGAWLCFATGGDQRLRHFARIIALFGITWFVCAGAAQSLLPLNPRYFMVTTVSACVVCGIALVKLASSRSQGARPLAAAAVAVLVAGNLAGILVENKDSQFGAQQLAVQAAEHRGETIFTDPMTQHRAELLLRWNRTTQQVSSEPPPPGSLYFHNPVHTIAANKKMPAERVALYQPQPGWIRVGARAPEPSFLARALETSGVAPMLPQGPWRKLRYRHPVVTLYRVGKPQD